MGAEWEGLREGSSFLASSTDNVCQAPGQAQLWRLQTCLTLPSRNPAFQSAGGAPGRGRHLWLPGQHLRGAVCALDPAGGLLPLHAEPQCPEQPGRAGTAGEAVPWGTPLSVPGIPALAGPKCRISWGGGAWGTATPDPRCFRHALHRSRRNRTGSVRRRNKP